MDKKKKNPYLKFYEQSYTAPPTHNQIEQANMPYSVPVKHETPEPRRQSAPMPLVVKAK